MEYQIHHILWCKQIETAVDNFDADTSSQNGKVSTYSLAILMTQTVAMESLGDGSR